MSHSFPEIREVHFIDENEEPDIRKIYPSVRYWKRIRSCKIGNFGWSHHFVVADYEFSERLYGIYSIGEVYKAIRSMNINPFKDE